MNDKTYTETETKALVAAALQRAAYLRTGVKDRDGREICVGDRICIDLSCPATKKEHWKPEYEVVFRPPYFDLKYVGGDKDSDTARFYWRVPQKSSTEKIATIFVALIPTDHAAPLEEVERLRAERDEWKRLYWLVRSFAVHDDDCTMNRHPHYRDCSCGLRAALTTPEEPKP